MVCSIVSLVVLLPFILFVALIAQFKLGSPRFRQIRLGVNGKLSRNRNVSTSPEPVL